MDSKRLSTCAKFLLFAVILFVLYVPFIEQKFEFYESVPLNGAFEKVENPTLEWDNWLSGEYQLELEKYCNQNFGFRNKMVRLYNQTTYSVFNMTKAKDIVIGRNDYLYEKVYIDSYLGLDFVGEEKIDSQVYKLEMVQDTLRKLGVEVLLVFAPGKAEYHPEYLPLECRERNGVSTNYSVFATKLSKSKANFADFQKWFLNQKDYSKFPLFTKTGIHWSVYGSYLAMDSIVSHINSISYKQLPTFRFSVNELSQTTMFTDDDIEKTLNLYYDIEDLRPLAYPTYQIDDRTGTDAPKVMVVADSFWSVFGYSLMDKLFGGGKFWFYGSQIYEVDSELVGHVDKVNVQQEVESNDVLLMLQTDSNLSNLGFSMVDRLYAIYFNHKK